MKVLPSRVESVPVGDVTPHPENPREGDVGLISQSIEKNGFFGRILVQESTGHIIAGNHRYRAALALGATEVPVEYIDVDDVAAKRILIVDNRSSDLATNNRGTLTEMLAQIVAAQGDLEGTGYDDDDFDRLLRDLDPVGPDAFAEFDEGIETEYCCPKCGYEWSGKPQ